MSLRQILNSRLSLLPLLAVLVLITGLNVSKWPQNRLERQLTPLVNDDRVPPTTAQCASCHREICDEFAKTGHAQSLWPGNDPKVIARFANLEYRWTSDGPLFRYVAEDDGLWLTQEDSPLRLHVDLVMGSGGKSQGLVQLITNPEGETEMLEHLLAWYPSVGLAPALGNDMKHFATEGMAALAQWQEHSNAKACIGCHSTYVPVDHAGKIQPSQLIGTVGCVRCHPDAAGHLAQNGNPAAFREHWSKMSPQAVIDRCGECHRRADETDPSDLNSESVRIVRFAPVGLSQSRCFKSQGAGDSNSPPVRLDCLSCHNLHRPLPKDTSVYQKVCSSCHYDEKGVGQPCRSQPQTSNCVSCHMPSIATDTNLRFTDHWIRVHKP